MWEQNDVGGAHRHRRWSATPSATARCSASSAPRRTSSATDTLLYASPGENHDDRRPDAGSSRTWPRSSPTTPTPATGACPAAPARRRSPPPIVDCFSEFLPTADWVGVRSDRTLHFRLTARDGNSVGGGVGSADDDAHARAQRRAVPRHLAGDAGERRRAARTQTVTWDVAGTDVPPINAANVKISLSDGRRPDVPDVLAGVDARTTARRA